MKDILTEISSNVPKSLPPFIKEQYDSDCSKFLKLAEEQWKNLEIYPMLTSVEKYLQYTVGENCQPTVESLDTLVSLAKKLWFISMYNIIDDLKSIVNLTNEELNSSYTQIRGLTRDSDIFVTYSQDPDFKHLNSLQNILTVKLRARSCKLLNTILENCIHLLPCIWEKESREKYEELNVKLSFVRIEVILRVFEEYFHSTSIHRMGCSYTKRRAWITCVVRLSSLIRRIWLYRRDMGKYLITYLFPEFGKGCAPDSSDSSTHDSESDVGQEGSVENELDRCELFYKFRVLLLLCPNSAVYDQLLSFNLFKWWELVNGDVVSSWNPMFLTFFFRAAKYAWAHGECVCGYFEDKMPKLFNILYNSFNLPNKPKHTKYKETMPGEYTCLLSKSLKLVKKMCKLCVLIMHPPLNIETECVNCVDKNTHEKCSSHEETKELVLDESKSVLDEEYYINQKDKTHKDIFEYISCLVNVVYPYTHPSNNGKWSLNISLFVKYMISAYSRKAIRERSKFTSIHGIRACCLQKNKKISELYEEAELRFDRSKLDYKVCELMYGVCRQGMFSKNIQICNNYEETIKRICHICPQDYFISTIEKFIQNCNTVNEPNQLLGSLRLLTQMSSLIVKLMPNAVHDLLHMLLSFINLSEPFITTQSLILISLLVSHASTITTSTTVTMSSGLAGFDDLQFNQCLGCHFDRFFFRCHIPKNMDANTMKRKLESSDYTYLDVILFVNNFCFCHIVAEKDGSNNEGSLSTTEGNERREGDASVKEDKSEADGVKDDVEGSDCVKDDKVVEDTTEDKSLSDTKVGSLGDKVPYSPKDTAEPIHAHQLGKKKYPNADPETIKEHRKILEQIVEIMKVSTAELLNTLNEWSIVYFETILEMCRNTSKVDMKGASLMNTVEVSTFLLVRSSLLNLLTKLSEETLTVMVNKLMKFINEYSYKLDIIKYVISIVALISNVNAGLLLRLSFTTIENNIINSFKTYEPNSKNDSSREADSRLIWYLNVLISVVRFGNINNPKYADRYKKIIEMGMNHHSKQVFKLTAKLVYRLNFSMHCPYMVIINNNNYHNYIVVEEQKVGKLKYKEITDNLKKEFEDKILIGWHMPILPEYKVYKELIIGQVNQINQLSQAIAPKSLENTSISTSGSIDTEKTDEELTLPNRINRILIVSKYLIKSISLIEVPTSKHGCGCTSSSLIYDVKRHIVSLMKTNEGVDAVDKKTIDEMELRYVVEAYIINVLVRINRYLDMNDLLVDRAKMTKLINFLVSKDFYSNEITGNNLDSLFNSLKRKIHFNTSITCTKPMVKYLSFYHGVNAKSYLQELNETAFVNLVQDHFNHIVNLQKLNPPTNYFANNSLLTKPVSALEGHKLDEQLQDERTVDDKSERPDEPIHRSDDLEPPVKSDTMGSASTDADSVDETRTISIDKEVRTSTTESPKPQALDTSKLEGSSEVKVMGKALLDILIDKMCINNYKNVSSNAQLILKNIMFLYKSTKYYIINSVLDQLNKLVDTLSQTPLEKDSSKETENFGDQVLENIITFFDMVTLNYVAVNLRLLEKFLTFVMKVISQSNNKDSLMSKYDVLFIQYLNLRESPSYYKRDITSFVEDDTKSNVESGEVVTRDLNPEKVHDKHNTDRVKRILKSLEPLVINHWRSNLYYCSLLLIYCEHVKNEEIFSNFFLQMCQNSTNHYVLSLSLQGLSIMLKDFNGQTKGDVEGSTSSPFNDKLRETLLDRDVANRVFRCFIYSNHENIMNTSSTPTSANTTTTIGYNIIMNIIKFDRTWPRNRISNNSNTISRHNFNLSHEYFKFIISNKGVESVDVWELLDELSQTPQSYPENHISFIEIVGGLLKYSLELDDEQNVNLWNKLHPILKNELNNVLYDRISDYMDVMRLILQPLNNPPTNYKCKPSKGSDSDKKLNYKYILNFILNYEVNPTSYNYENVFLLESSKDVVTGYNSIIIKQLKLFQALLQEYKKDSLTNLTMYVPEERAESLVKKILKTLLDNVFNDSQKIRDEISLILSYMLSMFKDKLVVDTINENMTRNLDENMELESKGVKGILNLIQMIYTLHVPFVRYDHANVYLEYSLKHLCSENVNVCELANKCVFNIVHHFGDYDKNRIFSIFKVLIKNSKSLNKIKLISFQLLDILYKNYCMYIKGLKVVEAMIQNYINCLSDTTVREVSKNNLTTIIITLNENNYNSLIQLFTNYINQYNDNKLKGVDNETKTSGSRDSLILGVYGMISLISTAPYHIPTWLPNVLVELARCGGSKYPLDIRNIVQKTLQEFFKNHIDAWEQIHSNKFTTEQLDLLNTYKGSPIYFN